MNRISVLQGLTTEGVGACKEVRGIEEGKNRMNVYMNIYSSLYEQR